MDSHIPIGIVKNGQMTNGEKVTAIMWKVLLASNPSSELFPNHQATIACGNVIILRGSIDIINNIPNIPLNGVEIFPLLIPKQSIERGS